jgi:hypothetical protein
MRASIILGTFLVTITHAAPAPAPSPTGVPSASTAKSELAALTVAAQGSQDGYSRALFPHWIIQVRISGTIHRPFFLTSHVSPQSKTVLLKNSG